MKRVIVDYNKLTKKILNLLVVKFADGYGIRDIVKFTNHKGQYIEAVEVSSGDTMYLVKISKELESSMEIHNDGEDIEFDSGIDENVKLEDVDFDDDK
ncbi:MAG: hypothetical protein COC16_01530 [Lutibacter sp.]|nr:MAG: hypothetical protein COC16_01530 [Lutibacter sp.]